MDIETIAVLIIEFDQYHQLIGKLNEASANGDVIKFYATIIISEFVVMAVFIAVLLLFYYLIYGLLLKKLNRNYRELKKLEV